MDKLDYRLSPLRITDKRGFADASAAELRVLIALIECGGHTDVTALSNAAAVSRARCISSLALWEEEGVITANPCKENGSDLINVVDEFTTNEIPETPSVDIAESLRDKDLAMVINECAVIMGRAALPTTDIRYITDLYTQFKLSPEYIITLAAHLQKKKKLSGLLLKKEAEKLYEKEIDTVEALEHHILDEYNVSDSVWEIRRVLGIRNRNLSATEKTVFSRWADEYGFSTEIIALAFDECVKNTGQLSLSYMNTVLTEWHKANCITVEDCKNRCEAGKKKRISSTGNKPRGPKEKEPKPRYGDFDVNDAFLAALERSNFLDEES